MAEVNSPEWWADRLTAKITKRRPELDRLESYFVGHTPLAYATSRFREEFGSMLAAINDNWTQLVVSAVEERLNVEGFRLGNDENADTRAWEIWQANRLDADSQVAHTEALKLREAHVIVWKPRPDQAPVITIEHPRHVCVELDPENRSKRLAAAKSWRDQVHGQCCTVYLPDGIYKFRRGRRGWERREVPNEPWPVPNEWGVVPVVPLFNRPGLLVESASEIENILSKQDMINKLMADMIVAAEYSAFRQRWATGVDIPTMPGTNAADDDFISAVNRLWHVAAPDAKFGEFGQTDLSTYVKAIEMLVQHIASQTATPPHYLLTTGVLPSGESLRAAEAPLVAKARRKQRVFGEAWEEVIRIALLMDGTVVDGQVSTIWSDPESRTESEHVDAVMKMKSLDVPTEELWRAVGFSQSEIDRMRRQRVEQLTMLALGQPITAIDGEGISASELKTRAEASQALVAGGMDLELALQKVGLAA
jgi:hypothetical protein